MTRLLVEWIEDGELASLESVMVQLLLGSERLSFLDEEPVFRRFGFCMDFKVVTFHFVFFSYPGQS